MVRPRASLLEAGYVVHEARGFAPGRHQIDAYGRGGFRFGGLSHIGSIAMLPSGVHATDICDGEDLRMEHFHAAIADRDEIELLLVGTGRAHRLLPLPVRELLRQENLRTEIMSTAAAARTYNVLFNEGRKVAAILIAVA